MWDVKNRIAEDFGACLCSWLFLPVLARAFSSAERRYSARRAEDNRAGSIADSCLPLQSICQPCTSRGNSCWLFSLRVVEARSVLSFCQLNYIPSPPLTPSSKQFRVWHSSCVDQRPSPNVALILEPRTFAITAVRGGDVGCRKQDCRGFRCMPMFVALSASPGQGIQFSRTQVFSPEG